MNEFTMVVNSVLKIYNALSGRFVTRRVVDKSTLAAIISNRYERIHQSSARAGTSGSIRAGYVADEKKAQSEKIFTALSLLVMAALSASLSELQKMERRN